LLIPQPGEDTQRSDISTTRQENNVMNKRCFTFALMDAPFDSARTSTAFRLLHAALDRGHDVNVFAYEGAAALSFARQMPHPNATHGRDAEQEAHPLPRLWIEKLQALAVRRGATLQWVNCGLCVDERGVGETIPGVKRGTPADFWGMAQAADNTLVIGTK
jgi:tRNA 2-thiouridine synthesizing protein D